MELFNPLIGDTRIALEAFTGRSWPFSQADCWKDIGSSELVLQRDAAFELGARGKGSANYVLFTSSPELVPEDRIVLYGPDLKDIKGDCDFARIVLLRIGMIDGDDENVYRVLKDIEFAKYHVFPEGYMVRISPESFREQVRVSREALKKGIGFKALGNSYIREYKKDPNVISAEVIFITDPSVDYKKLQDLAKKSTAAIGTLTHILEGLPTDCSVCALKDICDEVEGMKELHFGVGNKSEKH